MKKQGKLINIAKDTVPEATELIKKTGVDNSPFIIIEIPEQNKIFGTWGKYKITTDYKTVEECKNDLESMTWNKIINIIALTNQILNNKYHGNNIRRRSPRIRK